MKIMYLVPHLSTGGMPQYTYLIMKKLVELGHQIYCVEYQDIAPIYRVQKDRIRNLLANNYTCLGEDKSEFFNILENVKPDVLHIQEIPELNFPDEFTTKIYENRLYKIVETTHAQGFDVRNDKRFFPDGFVFVNKSHVSQYEHLDIPYEIVFPSLEDNERPDRTSGLQGLGLDPDKKHVLNVGLFTRRKNQGEIFELAKKLPDIQFHFIGNQAGNFADYWQPLMKTKPDNCTVWGERNDMDLFYSCMDLFLFSSKPEGGDQETCPMVIKEALSWKMPVYCYRMDTYGDMYDNNELVTYIADMYNDVSTFFDLRDSKCYLVSCYTDDKQEHSMKEQFEISNLNFSTYCKKHNYELRNYYNPLGNNEDNRHLVWSKVRALQDTFNECNNGDLILWVDADIVITNKDIRIEDMIEDGVDVSFGLTEENDLKLSVIVFRKTDLTTMLMDEWWNNDFLKYKEKAQELGYSDPYELYSVPFNPPFPHEVHILRILFGISGGDRKLFSGFEEFKNIFGELDVSYCAFSEDEHDHRSFLLHVPGGKGRSDGSVELRTDLERALILKEHNLPEKAFFTYCDENFLDMAENLVRSVELNSDHPIILYTINCDAEFDYPNLYKIRYDEPLVDVPLSGEDNMAGNGHYWILGIKPKLFLDILSRGVETVIYLDSDILVGDTIDDLWNNDLDEYPLGTAHSFQYCILNGVLEPGWEMYNFFGLGDRYPKPEYDNITVGEWGSHWYRQGCFSMFDRSSIWFIEEWWELCCHEEMLKSASRYYPYREETPYNFLFDKYSYSRKLPQLFVNIVDYEHYLRFCEGNVVPSPGFHTINGEGSVKTLDSDTQWQHFDPNRENIKFYHGIGGQLTALSDRVAFGDSILEHMGSARKFYSDYGEDKWISENLLKGSRTIGDDIPAIFFGGKGFYVDVGSAHPTENSNTAFLRNRGWDGVCIDANPHWEKLWKDENVNFANVAISSTETEVKMLVPYLTSNPEELLPQCTTQVDSNYQIGGNCGEVIARACTLDNIIDEYGIPEIDLLDIDVEGFELDVWKSLTKIKPKIIIVEYNTSEVLDFRCRDELLNSGDYELVYTTEVNDIFIKLEYLHRGLRPVEKTGGGHVYQDHPDYGALMWMLNEFGVKSMVDIGGAYCSQVKLARDNGIDAIGVDGDWSMPYYEFRKWNDYTYSSCHGLEDSYDLGWSVEFVEHIEEKYRANYMTDFKKCKYVILTTSEVDGEHHVNVNPVSYWIDLFESYGFKYDQENTKKLKEVSTMSTGVGLPPGSLYGNIMPSFIERSGMFFINKEVSE